MPLSRSMATITVVDQSAEPSDRFARPQKDFCVKDILIGSVMIALAVLINRLGFTGNIAFFILLILLAARSPRSAFQALALGLLALCTNNALVIKSIIWAFARFLMVLGLSARFLINDLPSIRGSLLRDHRYVFLCVFAFTAAVTSILSGNRPDLALMKDFNFWFGLSGFFAAVLVLRKTQQDITPWMITLITGSCILCWLAFVLGLGKNFKGDITPVGLYNLGFFHSQTLGPLSALMLLYVVSVFLFTNYRNRWLCLPLIASLLIALRMSGSRTGAITLLSGLSVIFICAVTWSRGPAFRLRKNLSPSVLLTTLTAFLLAAIAFNFQSGGSLSKAAMAFAAKKGNSGQEIEGLTLDQATATRRGLIDRSLQNFSQSPIYGNGFQIYADREYMSDKTFLTAQIEKGFLPAAILEETGVLGTLSFLLFILSWLADAIRQRNIPSLALFTGLLFMNLGECSFFSLGGQGAYAWLMVMAGDLLGDRCKVPYSQSFTKSRRPSAHRSPPDPAAA